MTELDLKSGELHRTEEIKSSEMERKEPTLQEVRPALLYMLCGTRAEQFIIMTVFEERL